MRFILALILSLFGGAAFASTEAEVFLLKMIESYKSLSVYEDIGISRTKFIETDGQSYVSELNFKTEYVENHMLQFKWVKQPNDLMKKLGGKFAEPKTYVVWKNKSGIFSKYKSKEEKYAELSTALSGATGISSSLAWMAPRFLSPEITCKPNLGAMASELIEINSDTIIIKQTHKSGTISKLYIDKDSYLLKKYEKNRELSNGTKTHQVAVYDVTKAK